MEKLLDDDSFRHDGSVCVSVGLGLGNEIKTVGEYLRASLVVDRDMTSPRDYRLLNNS
jgi:hypothetical protein